ncbi:macro domain-containing protein [Natronorubrum halophilum]|uniref:macro domain-containing protein n=1 Tax=Natronorubrum halophilum TaxID=1702106 RepID=UPI001EE7E28E|nr:macro domain-containing protein [Natronorubrum halophilum]
MRADSHGDGRATSESVRTATRKSLEKADTLGCESVVLPVLGTGAAGFDFREGARYVCEMIRDYEPSSVTNTRVIAYSKREYDELETIGEAVR